MKSFIIKKVNDKEIKIPQNEIDKLIKYGMTKEEAIETWLCDNDYLECEEEKILTEKAKSVKLPNARAEKEKKPPKPRTHKTSDEKKVLFQTLVDALNEFSYTIEKENKLILVKFNDKVFKIDLVETRPPKS